MKAKAKKSSINYSYTPPKAAAPKAKTVEAKEAKSRSFWNPAPASSTTTYQNKSIRLLTSILAAVGKTNDLLAEGSGQAGVTKQDLDKLGDKIMSKISDWAGIVGPKLDKVQTGLDALQKLVEDFQNSPGAITPEDQALLDQIEAKVDAIATDADSVTPPPPGDDGGNPPAQARNR